MTLCYLALFYALYNTFSIHDRKYRILHMNTSPYLTNISETTKFNTSLNAYSLVKKKDCLEDKNLNKENVKYSLNLV